MRMEMKMRREGRWRASDRETGMAIGLGKEEWALVPATTGGWD